MAREARSSKVTQRLLRGLRGLEGVEESPSQFSDRPAWWVNGKEIAHLDPEGGLDLRLGREAIRARRAQLKADPRVTLRRSGADWLSVRVAGAADLTFALELCELAAAAHRAPPGRPPAPPPAGPALERRRRWH